MQPAGRAGSPLTSTMRAALYSRSMHALALVLRLARLGRQLLVNPVAALVLVPIMAAAIAGSLAGCTEPRSRACKEVCKREAECVDQTGDKIPFDEKECVAACAVLEHDVQHTAEKVRRHIECVNRQTSCPAVLECK